MQKAGIKPICHLHHNYILFGRYTLDGPLKRNSFILRRKYLRPDSSNKSLYLIHYLECHAVILRGSCNMCWHISYNFKNLYTIADIILFLTCWNYLWRVTALTAGRVPFSSLLKVWRSLNETSVRFESCFHKYLSF